MKKYFLLSGVLAFAFALVGGVSPASAAVSNGSFEDGSANPGSFSTLGTGSTVIDNWTVDSGSIDYIGTYWSAFDGVRSIDMNGLAAGSISQTIPTLVGRDYKVTFDLSGNPDGLNDTKRVSVSAASDSEDFDYSVTDANTRTSMNWTSQSFEFTATGLSTTLTFASQIPGAYGPALDNVVVELLPDTTLPTTPNIIGFKNPTLSTLSCGVVTSIHSTTVDWSDSTDASGIAGYEYAINYPLADGSGQGDWTTFVVPSQYGGLLYEGVHTVEVRAKDNAGNYSEWSNKCSITADWTAPDVEITAPFDGDVVDGTVEVKGTVTDDNPWRYYTVLVNSSNNVVAGPGTVSRDDLLTGEFLFSFNADLLEEGDYTIRLEAHDKANNKEDPGSSVDVIKITISDGDGVDQGDMCLGTDHDSMTLNPNHFGWSSDLGFVMGENKGKSDKAKGPKASYSMEDTMGCSCTQILDWLSAEYPEQYGDLEDQYEYGCTIGTMNEFVSLIEE